MEKPQIYVLPDLPYGYKDLEPYMSEEQLRIHHDKHHAGYVKNANAIFENLAKARKEGTDLDMKSTLKSLAFNASGHVLHSLFWPIMAPAGKGGGKPGGALGDLLDEEFGSFDRFKKEFTQAAVSAEGSGWASLTIDSLTARPLIMQIEKHNVNVYPGFALLMVLDVWEHAYYIDHKNMRDKFVEAFWNIVNWDEVGKRLERSR